MKIYMCHGSAPSSEVSEKDFSDLLKENKRLKSELERLKRENDMLSSETELD
jgi:hypothetical protein